MYSVGIDVAERIFEDNLQIKNLYDLLSEPYF